MSKDLHMKIPSDLSKIDVNDLGELIWWSAHLDIGPEELMSIICKVGSSLESIRKYQETRHKEENKKGSNIHVLSKAI